MSLSVAEDRVLDLVAGLDAEQARAAAVDLEHARTGNWLGTASVDNGTALAWTCLIVPSPAMNTMSSGISVFFIQKLTGASWWKSNSMPS